MHLLRIKWVEFKLQPTSHLATHGESKAVEYLTEGLIKVFKRSFSLHCGAIKTRWVTSNHNQFIIIVMVDAHHLMSWGTDSWWLFLPFTLKQINHKILKWLCPSAGLCLSNWEPGSQNYSAAALQNSGHSWTIHSNSETLYFSRNTLSAVGWVSAHFGGLVALCCSCLFSEDCQSEVLLRPLTVPPLLDTAAAFQTWSSSSCVLF